MSRFLRRCKVHGGWRAFRRWKLTTFTSQRIAHSGVRTASRLPYLRRYLRLRSASGADVEQISAVRRMNRACTHRKRNTQRRTCATAVCDLSRENAQPGTMGRAERFSVRLLTYRSIVRLSVRNAIRFFLFSPFFFFLVSETQLRSEKDPRRRETPSWRDRSFSPL